MYEPVISYKYYFIFATSGFDYENRYESDYSPKTVLELDFREPNEPWFKNLQKVDFEHVPTIEFSQNFAGM